MAEHLPGFDGSHLHEDRIDHPVGRLAESILGDSRMRHISAAFLPHRHETLEILERLTWLMFPGFVGPRELSVERLGIHVDEVVRDLGTRLVKQVSAALRYKENVARGAPDFAQRSDHCDRRAGAIVEGFLARLPEVRRLLSLDVQAAFDGDPAAEHTDEIIFSYPGLRAVTIHRLAHELHRLEVPLLPRIMSEHAHSVTGIDIHPGAKIGESFFIDHGTGVVIGATSVIGAHCRIYQGVTLGAKSFPKDERGRLKRGTKRHPTLEDHVIVYAGATILGGDTLIGAGSVISGGVFLTQSIPPGTVVRGPKVDVRTRSNPETPPANYAI
jgi:serine O-acetyltransferase